MLQKMIWRIWVIKYYLLLAIAVTTGLPFQSKSLNHRYGLRSKSKDIRKHQKNRSFRDFTPLKKFFATVNDQLKQVINKLPNDVHRSKSLQRRGLRSKPKQKDSNLFKRKLRNYGARVPSSGIVVEVLDQAGFDNDVLKRDEIRRPGVTRGISGIRRDNVGIMRGNLGRKGVPEQSLTEVVDDDGGDEGMEEDISDKDSTLEDSMSSKSRNIDEISNIKDSSEEMENRPNNGKPTSEKAFEGSDYIPDKSIDKEREYSNAENVYNKDSGETKLSMNLNIPDIDKNDIKSLRKMITSVKANYGKPKDVRHSVDKLNVSDQIQYNGTVDNDSNNNMKTDNLDVMPDSNGVTTEPNKFTSVTNKNNNYKSSSNKNNYENANDNKSNNNNNNNNNNSSSDSSSNNNNNNNNNSSDNMDDNISDSDELLDEGNGIRELLNSIGSLKSKEKGITDEQLGKLTETVQDILKLKTVPNTEQTKAFATGAAAWSQWSIWSACSATCDDGKRTRRRKCGSKLTEDDNTCPGSGFQTEPCVVRHCPVDGGYTDWTAWSSCSETCGQQSIQMRMRICMNPRPQYGGKDCPGARFKIRRCSTSPCQDESATEETSKPTKGKNKDQPSDDSNELLDSLKAILQLKTSTLEDKLSDVSSDVSSGSASKLFDTIYQGSSGITTSDTSENASNTDDTATELSSSNKQNESNTSLENILPKAENIDSTSSGISSRESDKESNKVTDTLLKPKLNQTLSNENPALPIDDKGLRKNKKNSSKEKVGTLSVRLKNTNDTADLERLSALIGKLHDSVRSETRPNSEKRLKTDQGDSERIRAELRNDSLIQSSPHGTHAWDSGGLNRSHEPRNTSVLPRTNDGGAKKFHSIFVDNDENGVTGNNVTETMSDEISTQNSVPSSKEETTVKSETKKHDGNIPNALISVEEKLMNSGESPGPGGRVQNSTVSVEEMLMNAGQSTGPDGHVQDPNISEEEKLMNSGQSSGLDGHFQNSKISEEEKLMNSGQSPGPDGHIQNSKISEEEKLMNSGQSSGPDGHVQNSNISEEEKLMNSGQSTDDHIQNSTISEEEKLMNSGQSPDGHTQNATIFEEEKIMDSEQSEALDSRIRDASSEKPGSDEGHVKSTFLKDAPKDEVRDQAVDSHVTLNTAAVSTNVNGSSSSSIMGVIRYYEDTPSDNGDSDKTSDNKTIDINENSVWSPWSTCSTSCGLGYQTRSKNICVKLPASEQYDCSHVKIQKKSCGAKACSEVHGRAKVHLVKVQKLQSENLHGLVNNDIVSLASRIPQVEDNVASAGTKHETEIMGLVRQELDADFLPWSVWGICSPTCGKGGTRIRTRKCQGRDKPNCIGATHDSESCFVKQCPVAGGWSTWSDWTRCSQSCGKSVKLRMRKCDNPAPLFGGEKCSGHGEEQIRCDVPACTVNGQWSMWMPWSDCPGSCGHALRHRSRGCDNPTPSGGGLNCVGESKQQLDCRLPSCPIDGGFSHWQSWSTCHRSCGENSFRTRFRFCNNPPPSDGGKTCHGDRLQISKCPIKACTEPVNGGFGQWSNWSSCSLDCKHGSVKQRTRFCDSPKPLHGGMECAGDDTEWKKCSVDDCKVDGGLSDWTAWSSCSQSCGDTAIMSRDRSCTKPPPSGGGKNCSGETFEVKFCEKKPCHQVERIPTPAAVKDDQQDTPLVETIINEKEQLLTEKKKGNNALFSDLKKKLIENLKKLAPDLGLSLGNNKTTTSTGDPRGKAKENGARRVVKVEASDHGETSKPNRTVTEVTEEVADAIAGGSRRKLGENGNSGDLKEQLKDPQGESEDDDIEEKAIEDLNPIKTCGFNPCRLAKCLSDPFADCLPNTDCDPVYYDSNGDVKKDCSVETTFLTVPASKLCERDPCKVSMCLSMPMAKCLTNALCRPVYFDETGNVLNCTGVLNTPVRLTCDRDPCVGKLCPVDPQARCFTDFECKSTFWNLNSKEEISKCKDPDTKELDDDQENADDRSETPSPFRKTLRRPWLRLSKSALDEIVKNSPNDDIFITRAKLKHIRGKNKLSSGHSGFTLTLDEHNKHYDDDLTSASDDDTDNPDAHATDDDNEIPYSFSRQKNPQFSLPRIPPDKLKQYNNPRKNPILTLTSLDAGQYQSQGGNGVDVTKDWKLKLKPPIHMNGYVESPQVYKVNTLAHDRDQNSEEFMLHHRKKGLFSEGLSSQDLTSEGLNSESLISEGLTSEGRLSDGFTSGGFSSEGLSPGRMSLGGLNSGETLSSEGLASGGVRGGNMRFTPAPTADDPIDSFMKSDAAHVGGEGIDTAHALTPNPYDNILKQDINDLQNALSNAEDTIPGESRSPGLRSPVIRQGLTAAFRAPELEKESQINLAELEASSPRGVIPRVGVPRGVIPRVGDPRAISSEVPPDDLTDSQGGRYVPLDSVIDDLRARITNFHQDPVNGNLGFP